MGKTVEKFGAEAVFVAPVGDKNDDRVPVIFDEIHAPVNDEFIPASEEGATIMTDGKKDSVAVNVDKVIAA